MINKWSESQGTLLQNQPKLCIRPKSLDVSYQRVLNPALNRPVWSPETCVIVTVTQASRIKRRVKATPNMFQVLNDLNPNHNPRPISF